MKIPQVFTLIPILGLIPRVCKNKKASITVRLPMPYSVGMTRFELATTRPPDAYKIGF